MHGARHIKWRAPFLFAAYTGVVVSMAKESRRCAMAGRRACPRPRPLSQGTDPERGEEAAPSPPARRARIKRGVVAGGEGRGEGGAQYAQGLLPGFYARAFSAEELAEIGRQLESPQRSMEMEVAVMRIMIRRVLERSGESDPLKALPVVRQGVDAICRALRTARVLSGESSDSLAAAFAVALREISEELGIGDGGEGST